MSSSSAKAAPNAEALTKAATSSTSWAAKVSDHSQESMRALGASAKALTTGLTALYAQSQDFAQVAFAANLSALKALSSARSPQEILELQTSHTKASVEQLVAEIGKLTDLCASSVKGALEPLQARSSAALKGAPPPAAKA